MAPRGRKVLQDVSNIRAAPLKELNNLKSQIKEKDAENESLREQVAELTAALEKTTLEAKQPKPEAKPLTNPFGSSMLPPLPALPKRCSTAYNHYVRQIRASPPPEFEGKTPREITAFIGQLWSNLSAEERQPFEAMCEDDKKRYQCEMEVYNKKKEEIETQRKALEMHFEEERVKAALALYDEYILEAQTKKETKVSKDPNAPKQPRNAYMHFASARRQEFNTENKEMSVQEVNKIISEEWNKLNTSTTKKAKTTLLQMKKLAEEDKARYAEEKREYDAKLAEEQAAKEEAERAEFDRVSSLALKTYQEKTEAEEHAREVMSILAEQEKAAKEEKRKAREEEKAAKEEKRKAREEEKAAKEEKKKAREEKKAQKEAKSRLPKRPRTAYILFSQEMRPRVAEANPEMPAKEIMRELGSMWSKADEQTKKRFEDCAAEDKIRYNEEMEAFHAAESA